MTDVTVGAGAVGRSEPRRGAIGFDWTILLWLTFAVILVVIVVNPIFRLVWESISSEDGGLTLDNYVKAYSRPRYWQALINTIMMGVGTALLSALLAVPLAWACVRSDMPGRGFIKLCVLAAFIIPPYLAAVGWVLLAGPNSGWLNKAWMWATGAPQGIFNIYSLTGLIVIMGLHLFFFIFVFTSSAESPEASAAAWSACSSGSSSRSAGHCDQGMASVSQKSHAAWRRPLPSTVVMSIARWRSPVAS